MYITERLYLRGAVTIRVQEVEEASMLLIPTTLIRQLYEFADCRLLEVLVIVICRELKQEPACFQSVT